jgi:hypothetical protein
VAEVDKRDELSGGSRVPGELFCGSAIPGGGGGLKPGGGGGKLILDHADEGKRKEFRILM